MGMAAMTQKPMPLGAHRHTASGRWFMQITSLETLMINLNTSTAAELDEVPRLKGHGFEIVRYREERGRFDEVRQLEEVPGLSGKWDGAEATVCIDR